MLPLNLLFSLLYLSVYFVAYVIQLFLFSLTRTFLLFFYILRNALHETKQAMVDVLMFESALSDEPVSMDGSSNTIEGFSLKDSLISFSFVVFKFAFLCLYSLFSILVIVTIGETFAKNYVLSSSSPSSSSLLGSSNDLAVYRRNGNTRVLLAEEETVETHYDARNGTVDVTSRKRRSLIGHY